MFTGCLWPGAAALCVKRTLMKRIILALALALALSALAAEGPRESEADNLREVAFKTLIYEAAAAQQGYRVYFLSLGNTWTNDRPFAIDPSDGFMKRFEGRTPPVRKVSQSRSVKGEVRDKISDQRGVIFTVTDLKWISDTEVEAKCSVFKAGLNAYTDKYTLTKKNNQWKVTDKKSLSIS